ncbi:MAG TPA: nucleotide-binding protein [Methanospirillum sp.]|uniref:NOB1 family endonuclease n=1 Tax=Methanospirillum sp. TaxID=45200 RepID=UPI002BE48E84|nr:nucleotide-binding protein [Methanospirillum sp.]HOJ96505.1 nucleotide-binding protein [Methanospirillum sp.]HOL41474.1 nucleotide-binding protein [Methanospirillum sp.]HPP78772.1 nucleotide-binding protein [Methanospirillum sp.]
MIPDLPVFILDTSAFFITFPVHGKMMTTPGVIHELQDLKGKARLEVLQSEGLIISEPDQQSINMIQMAADQSGDRTVLSPVDIEILALAYEVRGIICSDDFALQNTAQYLSIPVNALLQRKAEKKQWKLRCRGCGKYYETMPPDSVCPVCGLEVKRKNK